MTLPLVVLRPEPGLSQTVIAAEALGLRPIAAPLFAIEPVAWDCPDPAAFDGLLLGSANAVRHGGRALEGLTSLPVFAVGEHTAGAAREHGFSIAGVGSGGLQPLIDTLRGPLRLLRLAAEERVDLDLPACITMEERIVYRARELPLSPLAAEAFRGGAVALLHSAAAARRLAAECTRCGIDRPQVALAALAPAIAAAAGEGWARVAVAPAVSDSALLALAADMCQKPPLPGGQEQV